MNVKNLSTDELRFLVQDAVEQALLEILGDPDRGRELRGEIRDRLSRSLAAVASGQPGIPAADVAKELRLDQ
jgi:ribose 1,5-bisphosphokinase PhnN